MDPFQIGDLVKLSKSGITNILAAPSVNKTFKEWVKKNIEEVFKVYQFEADKIFLSYPITGGVISDYFYNTEITLVQDWDK